MKARAEIEMMLGELFTNADLLGERGVGARLALGWMLDAVTGTELRQMYISSDSTPLRERPLSDA